MSDRIAIVSVAGRFPGSGADLGAFWGRVAAAEDCSREVPAGRWVLPPGRCTDPRVAHPDTVYSTRGYYLDPFAPDLADLDLDLALVAQLDPLFQLVLDAGNRAFRDARTEKIDRSRVGVVLGNICLPTDGSSDLCREILGPKVGLPPGPGTHPLNRYVAGLPAGLLARGLRLGLGSYTLDAACASSLYAIKLAADELMAGRADAMLAGGCSRPDCQYTQMGFAQLRALSAAGRCRPFDAGADGLMVGEGAGVFVLKRLSDALKHGDTILATIAGVGLSNDMHGNLLAPAKEGQLRAMRRAYETAEWDPTHADLIECHATGTPVGDAIEFDSLRELWGESGWTAGQCAIGSVKSTVGHLLTGAGAAALAKVLLAIKNETLPPQANFGTPASGLKYAGGPFRVLGRAEKWERRAASEPRRAAVSGFGFGGVNAHLLVEEWTGAPVPKPKTFAVTPKALRVHEAKWKPPAGAGAAVPVAVVGIGAHFGPSSDTLRAFQERALSGDAPAQVPKLNGWRLANAASPPGFGIEALAVPIDRFRIPPKELEETLPQQLLVLQVAAAALDDCRAGVKLNAGDAPTTGVFVGLGLDPNTTNYHLRWAALSNPEGSPDAASPPLSANRTMGALGSIAASRIARTFHVGGPSHTVCSEEGSAARALELGVRALQSGELDRAIVGGVDLACDPRTVLPGKVKSPGEGAAAFVLKRLDDAKRDGDRVYAVVRGVGTAADAKTARARAEHDAGEPFDTAVRFDAARDVGEAGAASAAASLAKACVALDQEILTAPARYWLRDRDEKPRRALVAASGADGTHFAVLLEEHAKKPTDPASSPEYAQPLGARNEGVFVVDGDSPQTLAAGLGRLAEFVARVAPEPVVGAVARSSLDTPLTMVGPPRPPRNVEAVAREWFRESPPNRVQPLAVALVARSTGELHEQVAFARESLAANPGAPFPATAKPALRDRVFYAPQPLGPKGKVAFVFPGSGNQFDGMGRDLSAQWPAALRRQQAENECLRGQYAPDHFWTGRALEAPARELMFGQVTVGALVSDIVASLGVRCDAMVGLSLGESAGLFGVRAWQGRDTMFRRMQQSTLFASDLAPPYDAARRYWGVPPDEDVDWVIGVVGVPADDVLAVLRPGLRAYLLIVNTPTECVIGGVRADVEKLAVVLGKSVTALRGVTLAHCEAGRPVEIPYRELHTLPVTPPAGVAVYSGAYGRAYKPTEKACADSITAGLLATIDVPAVVNAAYRDGVRAFVEVGPGNSCVRMIDAVLGDRPHLARAAHAARQDAASQVLRLVAHLAAERFPVNLAALYGQESLCSAHQDRTALVRKELVVPVGGAWAAVPPTPPVPPELDPSTISTPMPTPIIVPTPQPVFVSTPAPVPIYDPALYAPLAVDPLAVTPPARVRGPGGVPPAATQSPVAVHLPAATIHHAPASQRVTLSAAATAPVAARPVPAEAVGLAEAAANVRTLAMQAQESFLRVNRGFIETAGRIVQMQVQLAEALARPATASRGR
ncbi:beta-ketoacyl synthase N-terminal-like domain-containing protein [Gemmata sp.]|uniref:beta-ketoacyl synthase N-terminal-like domain-containing protein n=1 Tax=Gemmata sp. TaxID=1914242 RepID=UPI003F72B31B